MVFCLALMTGVGATAWYARAGAILDNGDAAAHLNIARRLTDSRAPGPLLLGSAWLPVPHLLMAPFAAIDWLWQTGLAGAAVNVPAYALLVALLFLLIHALTGSIGAAAAGAALVALNPNLLYLAATPMTEPLSLCLLMATAYAAWSGRAPVLTGLLATLLCLTRYEAWAMVPVIALLYGRNRGWRAAAQFTAVATAGPLWWTLHNWWFYGDALAFYRGEFSARAIYLRQLARGVPRYPAEGHWPLAFEYYGRAAWLAIGVSIVGIGGWLSKRKAWPLAAVLLAPAAMIIWTLHSAGTQIYVPGLWPDVLFNTRYGLALLPAVAVGAGLAAERMRWAPAAVAVLAAAAWVYPRPAIVVEESHRIGRNREQWTTQAAAFLKERYQGGGIALAFGDQAAVLQQAGIPLAESIDLDNRPAWLARMGRPDVHLQEEWVLCQEGDELSQAARRSGHYTVAQRFQQTELWRRDPRPVTRPAAPVR